MLRRSTVVILIIAVVLVAATLYWQRTRESRETSLEATPTAVGEQLEFDFTSAQVSEAIIQDADGNSVILERGEDGSWILVQPEAEMTDSQQVENALTQFLDPQTVSQISGQTPLSDLGLDPPAYRILLGLEDGSEEGVNIGKVTPTGSGYYVLVSGKGFFIIREFSLDQLLNLIIEPPVATPTATPTASSTPTPGGEAEATPTP